jgi:hypothetical protein
MPSLKILKTDLTVTIDELISFLNTVKVKHGNLKVYTEYDCETCDLSSAEITSDSITFY